MSEQKLVVCVMGQDCQKFISMCLESVKEADDIVYCDGGSSDDTLYIVEDFKMQEPDWKHEEGDGSTWRYNPIVIINPFDQEDPEMNGKQRNFYLKYLKENYPDHWVLCLDADEVVEDLTKIKNFIQIAPKGVYYVKMRHFQQDLGHEDATQQEHFVPARLFHISDADIYPEVEHPVLQAKSGKYMAMRNTTIWHLAYIPNLWDIKRRYENHMKKSNMHTPEFLDNWYRQHLFGTYPKKPLNPVEIPEIILKEFGIEKDELYFQQRGLEVKHFLDAINWKKHFNCKTAIEFGAGLGPRTFAMNMVGIDAMGIELSQWAVDHCITHVKQGDITKVKEHGKADLVVAYDVLEHIAYEDLDKAIENIKLNTKKNALISVPTLGDPNLENDPTHIIKESMDWWKQKFKDHGFKVEKTPEDFLFKHQLIVLSV